MNILPKKSWHVRTKANIERVRRDEAKAAAEEKEKQQRIAIAEQEARTRLLRQRAEERALSSGEPSTSSNNERQVEVAQEAKHINFWSEFEQGKTTSRENAEYAQEKKDEKEKYEKDIGLLTYLGQSAAETQSTKPWYHLPPDKRGSREEEAKKPGSKKTEEEFDRKRKQANDPMRMMSNFLEKKRKYDDHKSHKEKHKEKKHKHKHKDERRESKTKSGSKTIEQLRAERLQREKAERQRTEALMAKLRGEKTETEKEEELDDRSRGYNSQFNPELARKHKPRSSHY